MVYKPNAPAVRAFTEVPSIPHLFLCSQDFGKHELLELPVCYNYTYEIALSQCTFPRARVASTRPSNLHSPYR